MLDTHGYRWVQSSYEPSLQCKCESDENANGDVVMRESGCEDLGWKLFPA